jgi:hypothetical protein
LATVAGSIGAAIEPTPFGEYIVSAVAGGFVAKAWYDFQTNRAEKAELKKKAEEAEKSKESETCNENSDDKISNDESESEKPSKQAGRGQSKDGKHEPENLREKLAMDEVISDPENGIELKGKNTDPRWPSDEGWEKWAQHVNGYEIHYEYNPITNEIDDVKIK